MPEESYYTYRLDIAYEGTLYAGWQIQPNATSIQSIIQEKLSCILKAPHTITGAGRTDAGVHALQQVAHFRTSHPIDTIRVMRSLNGMLPLDIRILSLTSAPIDFHARKSATAKEYHYTIITGPLVLPQDRRYAWHIFQALDIAKIEQATGYFIGTHDFLAYANENTKGAAAKNSIRTIYELRIHRELYSKQAPYQQKIRLEFYGNGFLYKMVRNITGMLVAIGSGRKTVEEIENTFYQRDRRSVDRSAPAHGLTLARIEYSRESASSMIDRSLGFQTES